MAECTNVAVSIDVESRESPGVLPLSYQERLSIVGVSATVQ